MIRRDKLEKYFPLIFFQIYFSGTVWLFLFGPWQWIVTDKLKFYSFLLAAQVMIAIGYVLAVRQDGRDKEPFAEFPKALLLFRLSLVVNILLAVPTAWARTNSWFPDILAGIQTPGAVYLDNVMRLSQWGPHVYVEYVRMLLSVLILPLFPLTIIYWRKISRTERFLAGITIAWYLSIFISVGQNKGLADAIATWAMLIIAGYFFHRMPLRSIAVKLPVAYFIALAFFFSYFGLTQLQRQGGAIPEQAGILAWQAPLDRAKSTGSAIDLTGSLRTERDLERRAATPTNIAAYPDHLVARIAPDFVRNVYESFARYLGQGYQAVAFSFDIEHPSTLGFGNSMFLARNVGRVLNTDFFESQSLPALLERDTGWSRTMQWHSIYLWIASDVGFLGTLFVMAGLGFLLAKSWVRTISTGDPLWATTLYLVLVMFYYTPGNNQVLQSGETTIGLVGLLLIILGRWLFSRFPKLAIWRVEALGNAR